MTTKLVTIPFCGFYSSIHDTNLDDAVEQMFYSNTTDGCNEKLQERVMDTCDWREVHKKYAKSYCGSFADKFEFLTLRFESLNSPKYYNFTTDRIFAEIDLEELQEIHSKIEWSVFVEHAKEMFTSRDGFSSFYDPDISTWGPITEWDHNQYTCLLEAYVGDFDQWEQHSLMEDAQGNGKFDEWICEATPEISRFYKIHDYLETRAERS